MKGVIFNLVEEVVRAERGDDSWDDIVDAAGVSGAYTSLGSYPDQDLVDLATSVAHHVGTDVSSVIRHVGHEGIDILATRYPEFFEPHEHLRSFLLTLNEIIHPEVRRLYPGAFVPEFVYGIVSDEVLELAYSSERGRCDLAEGLILGAAQYFGEHAVVTQPVCIRNGDSSCVLRVETP